MIELNKIYNEDCLEGMKKIQDNSIDVILTDPPYLYLKNQKLDRPFDEVAFFDEAKRVLKKDGFIVLFGRGTSFYRWNTMLADRGFNFKEEVIWNKAYITSPLLALLRVHECISIYSKGKGKIHRCKVPYIEAKQNDIESILGDIRRLKSILHNPASLKAVEDFLVNNNIDYSQDREHKYDVSAQPGFKNEDRCAAVSRAMKDGCTERSIIRTDLQACDKANKANLHGDMLVGDRACNVISSIHAGCSEKSIIKQVRDHYSAIHPTQKPVRLLERLLNLVCKDGVTVLDPFSGSGSTAVACIKTNRQYIGFEIDEEYYKSSQERVLEVG